MKIKLLFLVLLLGIFFLFVQEEVNLLGIWSDFNLVGLVFYNNIYNEIWGFVVNGYEYVVFGFIVGMYFIDVMDFMQFFEVYFVVGVVQGLVIIYCDYYDYKGYLYVVCDEG